MALALTIDWSPEFVAVTIVDGAARTIVAEGRSPLDGDRSEKGSPLLSWSALGDATRTALDGLAVLNLTTEDIGTIELSGRVPDETGDGGGSLSMLSALMDPIPEATEATEATSSSIGDGVLSLSAASAFGLPPGRPIHLNPSFTNSLRPGDQVL